MLGATLRSLAWKPGCPGGRALAPGHQHGPAIVLQEAGFLPSSLSSLLSPVDTQG